MESFIMTLRCHDAPGIVSGAAGAIAQAGGNILENDQFSDPVTETFCMRSRFEADGDVASIERALTDAIARFDPQIALRLESDLRRAVVLVSQYDHCLADLLYHREHGDLPLEIAAVFSNHETCRALTERHDVPFFSQEVTSASKRVFEDQIMNVVTESGAELVILARYMQILSPTFCEAMPGRIINIHHSFLPGFKGARPYHQAYERGVKLVGATAHYVTTELDEGPIIDQDVVRVSHARQPKDLVAIGRDLERTVLSRAVKLVAEDRVALVGKRTVIFSQ
jgi:formyltetrahydrofolate deformylase